MGYLSSNVMATTVYVDLERSVTWREEFCICMDTDDTCSLLFHSGRMLIAGDRTVA